MLTIERKRTTCPGVAVALLLTSLAALARPDLAAQATDERAVAAVLDDFHDAAARADEARYFGHFAPEAVFMGTDATERWPLAAFRAFAAPHFEKESAWRFTPKNRHVVIAPGGEFAWFDEVADSEHMGACRGTGALRKIDGDWKIAHYNLTLPIPNGLIREFAARIRRHLADGEGDPPRKAAATAAEKATGDTVVFVVRHAEKGSIGRDPNLSPVGAKRAAALAEVLAHEKLTAAYATEYKRTQETVRPAAQKAGVEPTILTARDLRGLVAKIREQNGGRVLVAGHSNTVPMLLRALGVKKRISLADHDYGDLFVVRLAARGTTMLRLRY